MESIYQKIKTNGKTGYYCSYCSSLIDLTKIIMSAINNREFVELIFCNWKCLLSWIKKNGEDYDYINLPEYIKKDDLKDFKALIK